MSNSMTKKKHHRLVLSLLGLVATLNVSPHLALAEETMGEEAKSGARGMKNDVKQSGRKAKKKFRDATGNANVVKDVRDGARNAGDDVDHQAKKTKDKID